MSMYEISHQTTQINGWFWTFMLHFVSNSFFFLQNSNMQQKQKRKQRSQAGAASNWITSALYRTFVTKRNEISLMKEHAAVLLYALPTLKPLISFIASSLKSQKLATVAGTFVIFIVMLDTTSPVSWLLNPYILLLSKVLWLLCVCYKVEYSILRY